MLHLCLVCIFHSIVLLYFSLNYPTRLLQQVSIRWKCFLEYKYTLVNSLQYIFVYSVILYMSASRGGKTVSKDIRKRLINAHETDISFSQMTTLYDVKKIISPPSSSTTRKTTTTTTTATLMR